MKTYKQTYVTQNKRCLLFSKVFLKHSFFRTFQINFSFHVVDVCAYVTVLVCIYRAQGHLFQPYGAGNVCCPHACQSFHFHQPNNGAIYGTNVLGQVQLPILRTPFDSTTPTDKAHLHTQTIQTYLSTPTHTYMQTQLHSHISHLASIGPTNLN